MKAYKKKLPRKIVLEAKCVVRASESTETIRWKSSIQAKIYWLKMCKNEQKKCHWQPYCDSGCSRTRVHFSSNQSFHAIAFCSKWFGLSWIMKFSSRHVLLRVFFSPVICDVCDNKLHEVATFSSEWKLFHSLRLKNEEIHATVKSSVCLNSFRYFFCHFRLFQCIRWARIWTSADGPSNEEKRIGKQATTAVK